ncbi:hypothetical protein HAU32_10515 [Weissella confusa]|uniref:DUF1642 domain-containing protein n=1 Tax=Weissella fermenti TaxID=2987699 RepID=A0ABT6D509_9LACO|nr:MULTISPECIES: hypothetical protein [Weissella]MBJ7689376.1 hypothetical protein [Weissella confusa]MCW0928016.1 hypothetical protein [Weissella sp. LMG 11983]MDF9300606.1 hypothetical protein [Weissella sp. BK2]
MARKDDTELFKVAAMDALRSEQQEIKQAGTFTVVERLPERYVVFDSRFREYMVHDKWVGSLNYHTTGNIDEAFVFDLKKDPQSDSLKILDWMLKNDPSLTMKQVVTTFENAVSVIEITKGWYIKEPSYATLSDWSERTSDLSLDSIEITCFFANAMQFDINNNGNSGHTLAQSIMANIPNSHLVWYRIRKFEVIDSDAI